jgi:hypothetical protein
MRLLSNVMLFSGFSDVLIAAALISNLKTVKIFFLQTVTFFSIGQVTLKTMLIDALCCKILSKELLVYMDDETF